jgi:hypothetical protein
MDPSVSKTTHLSAPILTFLSDIVPTVPWHSHSLADIQNKSASSLKTKRSTAEKPKAQV